MKKKILIIYLIKILYKILNFIIQLLKIEIKINKI